MAIAFAVIGGNWKSQEPGEENDKTRGRRFFRDKSDVKYFFGKKREILLIINRPYDRLNY